MSKSRPILGRAGAYPRFLYVEGLPWRYAYLGCLIAWQISAKFVFVTLHLIVFISMCVYFINNFTSKIYFWANESTNASQKLLIFNEYFLQYLKNCQKLNLKRQEFNYTPVCVMIGLQAAVADSPIWLPDITALRIQTRICKTTQLKASIYQLSK